MLLPLDLKWTWEAWAAAQIAADPWKSPYTSDEIAIIVHRAYVAGIRPEEMVEILHVPYHEIWRMLRAVPPPDDSWREEMRELISVFRGKVLAAKAQGVSLLPSHTDERKRLREMIGTAKIQLNHAIDLAPPEVVAQLQEAMEEDQRSEAVIEAYFDLLQRPLDGALPFPSLDPGGVLGPKQVRAGFRSISRVLQDLGLTWLNGYPPIVQQASSAMQTLVRAKLSANPALAASLDRVTC